MLLFFHFESCPFCMKVRNFLEENNIDYISLVTPKNSKSRQILEKLGGKQQVPFLVDFDEGNMMYESDAIIEYLSDKYV